MMTIATHQKFPQMASGGESSFLFGQIDVGMHTDTGRCMYIQRILFFVMFALILVLSYTPSLTDVDLGGFIGHQRLRNQDALSIGILFSIFMFVFFLLAKYFEKKFSGKSENGKRVSGHE